MKKIQLNVGGENKGHYAPGIISNGMLYISGQLSIDLNTRKVPDGGVEEHMKLALHNVDLVLNAAGLGRDDLVMCRLYISDINDWDKVNEVYQDFFGEHTPARIVVPVTTMHFGCLVEIEGIAECNSK